MPDDRIKISWDELSSTDCNSTGKETYTPPPQATAQSRLGPDSAANRINTPWLIAGIFGTAVVLGIIFFAYRWGMTNNETAIHRQTVDEWCAQTTMEMNQELAIPNCPMRKRIEDAHVSVNVLYAKIISLTARTLDGTKYSDDGRNIAAFKAKIEFTWDGVIQKGGYTILEIEYDVQNDSMIKSEITQTNAVINLEDPDFWFDVGRSIGPLLAPQPGVY